MAQAKPKTYEAKASSMKKEVQRGTQDELEILALIVVENLNIYNSVMERMRGVKARMGIKPGASAENAGAATKK